MKKLLAIMLTFVLCFGVLSIAFAAENETTVPDGYTGIYTAEDLDGIRNNLSGKYILMNDIDLSSYGNWNPIGTSEAPFTGELDGNGYAVKNLTIKGEYSSDSFLYFALFASAENSFFLNLSVINANIDVKYIGSTIQLYRTGIIAGYGNGITVKNCIVSGKIKMDGFYKGSVGGFIGKANMLSISNCANYADINVFNLNNPVNVSAGGISGISTNGDTSECCNYGKITVEGMDISVEHRKIYAGGIYGNSDGSADRITDCFNRGKISLNFSAPSAYVGGITGEAYIIENSYNSGDITVTENYEGFVGGVSGDHWTDGLAVVPSPYIENTYYINERLYPSYVNSYAPDENDFSSVKLLTEEEFKIQKSFVGFDFETVWEMEENGYPVLQNTPKLSENSEKPTTATTISPSTETTVEPITVESTTIPVIKPTITTVSEPTTVNFTQPSTTRPAVTTPSVTHPEEDIGSTTTNTQADNNSDNGGEDSIVRTIIEFFENATMKIIGFFTWILDIITSGFESLSDLIA